MNEIRRERDGAPEQESKLERVTLAEEWAELSAALCSPEFIRSLGDFFKSKNIQKILECACGDGHVLRGLADDGLQGTGVDADPFMIKRANEKNYHPSLNYSEGDILHLDNLPATKDGQFDAVMCRGNSLSSLGAWNTTKETFDPERCEEAIRQGLHQMWSRVKEGGVLYLDVTSQEDIDKGDQRLPFDSDKIHLIGEITVDREHKRRDVFGRGTVGGKPFEGGSSSYLMEPEELRSLIDELLKPKRIWTPTEVKDAVYEVICAEK